MLNYETILKFWFKDLSPEEWWKKDTKLDAFISNSFSDVHKAATQCELYEWRESSAGRLAEIIVLDQFSRNIYRDQPQAFAYDNQALALAQKAVAKSSDQELPLPQKAFLYMPYMHSESKIIHEIAVELFSQKGLESNYNFELKHKKIIDRFDRYPHRNKILNRKSTQAELEFLKGPDSSF